MTEISILSSFVDLVNSVSLATIENNTELAEKFKKSIGLLIEHYGNSTDPLALAVFNDIAKAATGSLDSPSSYPVLNNDLKSIPNGETAKSFLNEIQKQTDRIMGSSYSELNEIGKKLAKIEENFLINIKKKNIIFHLQIQIYFAILKAQYLIVREASLFGKKSIPCFDDTKNIDERSRSLVVLAINIAEILKYEKIYKDSKSFQKIIADIKAEMLVYNGEDIDKLLLLTRKADAFINSSKVNISRQQPASTTIPSETLRNLTPTKKKTLKINNGFPFFNKIKLIKLKYEYGSKEKPVMLIKREPNYTWLQTRYVSDDGLFVEIQEIFPKNDDAAVCAMRKESSIPIGFSKSIVGLRNNLHKTIVGHSPVPFYFSLCGSPKKITAIKDHSFCFLKFYSYKSSDYTGEIVSSYEINYSDDGSLHIYKMMPNVSRAIEESYEIHIEDNILYIRVYFNNNGKKSYFLITRQFLPDEPSYVYTYKTNIYELVGDNKTLIDSYTCSDFDYGLEDLDYLKDSQKKVL